MASAYDIYSNTYNDMLAQRASEENAAQAQNQEALRQLQGTRDTGLRDSYVKYMQNVRQYPQIASAVGQTGGGTETSTTRLMLDREEGDNALNRDYMSNQTAQNMAYQQRIGNIRNNYLSYLSDLRAKMAEATPVASGGGGYSGGYRAGASGGGATGGGELLGGDTRGTYQTRNIYDQLAERYNNNKDSSYSLGSRWQ